MQTNYTLFETAAADPHPTSMMETLRAIGYTIQAAVADIIDNSISAGAKNIWIDFDWKGSETWLAIKDDGCGMSNEELIQAMRPGSKNPNDVRASKDLGRFGLGLKTASFSQCRKLTAVSKKRNESIVYWTWDLDYVNTTGKWNLINYLPDQSFASQIHEFNSGTIIIWNDIDRLVKNLQQNDVKALDKFLLIMEQVKIHLSMIFHRFIESKKIKLHFQKKLIEAWNPFMSDEVPRQGFPEEPLYGGKVKVKGFVLPHKSLLSEDEFKKGSGPRGWNEHQGFYIYRNNRLLLAGDWLGMFRKEEHYKLARIEIDLPNNLDAEWQIDIKKSVARPPLILRDQLKAYAGTVRAQAVEVYRHRVKTVKPLPGQKFIPLWLESKRGQKWFHKINRAHPLLELAKEQLKVNPEKAFEQLIRFIEETIPSKSIYIKEAEEPEAEGKPFEATDQEPIKKAMQQMYSNLLNQGKNEAQAKAIILNIEPFHHFPHFTEFLN